MKVFPEALHLEQSGPPLWRCVYKRREVVRRGRAAATYRTRSERSEIQTRARRIKKTAWLQPEVVVPADSPLAVVLRPMERQRRRTSHLPNHGLQPRWACREPYRSSEVLPADRGKEKDKKDIRKILLHIEKNETHTTRRYVGGDLAQIEED